MEESKACLYSYKFDGTGGGNPVDAAHIPDDGGLYWVHLNGRHADVRKFLKENLKLDPLIIKSLLAEETRPRIEEVDGSALLILRGILFNPGPEPEDLVSVRVWVSPTRIISVGRRKSKAIEELHERIHQRRGPKKVGEFISLLCSHLHDGIEHVVAELEDQTDRLEEATLDHPEASMRNDIATIRKQAILFRRHMAPQRDVISRLQNSKQEWMLAGDKWYMQDNYDRVTRHVEDLDAIRERSQIVQDELSSALAARLNKNLYLLSVITVIFMPLTFLTGLLGANVDGIPGAHHPFAFGIVVAVMLLVVLIEVLIFKRLKWF